MFKFITKSSQVKREAIFHSVVITIAIITLSLLSLLSSFKGQSLFKDIENNYIKFGKIAETLNRDVHNLLYKYNKLAKGQSSTAQQELIIIPSLEKKINNTIDTLRIQTIERLSRNSDLQPPPEFNELKKQLASLSKLAHGISASQLQGDKGKSIKHRILLSEGILNFTVLFASFNVKINQEINKILSKTTSVLGIYSKITIIVTITFLCLFIFLIFRILTKLKIQILSPIAMLSQASKDILTGNFKGIDQQHGGEFQGLFDEFNNMQMEIQKSQNKLIAKNNELTKSFNHIDSIFSSIPNPLFVLNKQLKIEKMNLRATKILHKKESEMLNTPFVDLFHPDFSKLAEKNPDFFIHNVTEINMLAGNGEVIPFLIYSSKKFDESNQFIGAVCLAYDLQDTKTKEKLIEEQKMKLIESDRLASLGMLAAGVGHEINNPLTIIQMATQFIKNKINIIGIKDNKITAKMNMLTESIDRISSIVDGLKGLARTDNGETEPVDIHECIKKTHNIVLGLGTK